VDGPLDAGRRRCARARGGGRSVVLAPEFRPRFPEGYRPGIGLVGCGTIAKQAHLPAYAKYGLHVAGVYDPNPAATDSVDARIFTSLDELLADPAVEVVDVATHPPVRLEVIRRAVEAGKHVLAQKPLALDARAAREVVEEAERRGVTVAVNQNGRWSPPWRIATLLADSGAVGEVFSVTHLFDHDFPWIVGTSFDELEHFVIYDFALHWIDITRCWLDGREVGAVRAWEYRTPAQPPESVAPLGAVIAFDYADGASGVIRSVGSSRTARPGDPFWIHGTEGTIRGSVRKGSDFVELEHSGETTRFELDGAWFPDGFAGAMGELLSAIAEEREPFNSARNNLLTLRMTLAACRSADEGGRAVALREIPA
jgi:predicted dehydrogenase